MKTLHIVPGLEDVVNGMAAVARMIAEEQGDAEVVDLRLWKSVAGLDDQDEVWVHGAWLPSEWRVCERALKTGVRIVRMPHGSYDPVRLGYHGWKKTLVGPIERFFLRRASVIVATCEAEREWIKAYLGKKCPHIEVTDIKRFFDLSRKGHKDHKDSGEVHLLYLGRRHPLKGVEYLEEAVRSLESGVKSSELNSQLTTHNSQLELKIVSNAFGEEKEKVWEWCDVLVLPTLSENFGLVVAEALERGKRVITTDGAPAWGDGNDYGGRLVYLKGFRDGSAGDRVLLLKNAIEKLMEKLL